MYRFTDKPLAPLYCALDTAVAIASLVLVLVVHSGSATRPLEPLFQTQIELKNVVLLSALALAWPPLFDAVGLYRFRELSTLAEEWSRIAKACALGSGFAIVFALLSFRGAAGVLAALAFLPTALIGAVSSRAASRSVLRFAASLRKHPRQVLVVGTGPRAMQQYAHLAEQTSSEVCGFVDTRVAPAPLGSSGPPFLGTLDSLEDILVTRPVDAVYIGLPVKSCYADIEDVIATCERVGVRCSHHADIFRRSLDHRSAYEFGNLVALEVVAHDCRLWAKRVIDVGGALFGLIVLSPVMIAAAVAIRLTGYGPVFFTQTRLGHNRRPIRMYKFRSMTVDAEALQAGLESTNEAEGPVFKILHDPRVTTVGRILRRTSIDELPQLLNVLKGEMSLVGPRPLPLRDVSRFTKASLMRRFSVKPGLTCLWQINGRSTASFEKWIEMDLRYIDQWSLRLDLAILVKTVPAVLRGQGAA